MDKRKRILLLDLRKIDENMLTQILDYLSGKEINWIWLDDYKIRKRFYPKIQNPKR